MPLGVFPKFIRNNYELHEWRHATAILAADFPNELADMIDVLNRFRMLRSYINKGGGRKSQLAAWIDEELANKGWVEKQFLTQIRVDNQTHNSPTHKIDCYKNRVALEIEWNNKDPFYDRDLNNFRLLFDLRTVSVGVIITRCDDLQTIFEDLGRGASYGQSTTHMSKLLPRIEGGGGGGCPLLVIGIKSSLYVEDDE
ncbi:BglII/BstYI family type II restriction endonuclease [Xanthomonas albilineans]|uniref:BglII/BstYI family type II restriction endonuclease n=1 Tax=Xanthomonas albilineans TaxID=29447 RepID=UPI0005F317C2|nr:BglII/BstYI family type II restriction endonuclease [Xanthomonas albilineans]